MRKLISAIFVFFFFLNLSIGQTNHIDTLKFITLTSDQKDILRKTQDSIYAVSFKDSIRNADMVASLQYPALKVETWSGVIPIKNVTAIPDPGMKYKLLFEFIQGVDDSLVGKVNPGLTEISRIINLHVASGIPLKNIETVIIVHGESMVAITNNEAYKKYFKIENPNIEALKKLENLGATLITCGQAMHFGNLKEEELLPEVKIAVAAKVVLSYYQLKGFVLYRIKGWEK